MARDPGSVWRPLPEAGAPDGHTKTQWIVHSTGTLATARNNAAFSPAPRCGRSRPSSSASTPPTRRCRSWTPPTRPHANTTASRRAIAVEIVGTGDMPFTPPQVGELIRIGRWAAWSIRHRRQGLPHSRRPGCGGTSCSAPPAPGRRSWGRSAPAGPASTGDRPWCSPRSSPPARRRTTTFPLPKRSRTPCSNRLVQVGAYGPGPVINAVGHAAHHSERAANGVALLLARAGDVTRPPSPGSSRRWSRRTWRRCPRRTCRGTRRPSPARRPDASRRAGRAERWRSR